MIAYEHPRTPSLPHSQAYRQLVSTEIPDYLELTKTVNKDNSKFWAQHINKFQLKNMLGCVHVYAHTCVLRGAGERSCFFSESE